MGLLACLPLVVRQSRQQLAESEARRSEQEGEPEAVLEASGSLPRRRSGARPSGGRLIWEEEEALSTAATAGSYAYKDQGRSEGRGEGEGDKEGEEEEEEELVEWPAAEQLLRQWFFRQVGCSARLCCLDAASAIGCSCDSRSVAGVRLGDGAAALQGLQLRCGQACSGHNTQHSPPRPARLPQGLWCARRPRLVLLLSLLAVGACALGLTRFRWAGLLHWEETLG